MIHKFQTSKGGGRDLEAAKRSLVFSLPCEGTLCVSWVIPRFCTRSGGITRCSLIFWSLIHTTLCSISKAHQESILAPIQCRGWRMTPGKVKYVNAFITQPLHWTLRGNGPTWSPWQILAQTAKLSNHTLAVYYMSIHLHLQPSVRYFSSQIYSRAAICPEKLLFFFPVLILLELFLNRKPLWLHSEEILTPTLKYPIYRNLC